MASCANLAAKTGLNLKADLEQRRSMVVESVDADIDPAEAGAEPVAHQHTQFSSVKGRVRCRSLDENGAVGPHQFGGASQ